MKVVLLADTHFGARSDSAAFNDSFKRFYEKVFFPYLDKTGIKTVVHLGDVFDRRKYINFQILKSCKEYFFDQLKEREIALIVIPGNHDTYFKNTNDVNSIGLLLGEYGNIQVIQKPGIHKLSDNSLIGLVPWICEDNVDASFDFIESTDVKVCLGHFEILGFEMHKGMGSHSGLDPEMFSKIGKVLSGHFHHKHTDKNIHYLGCPYEMTWSDFDDTKGFHVLDTHDWSIEFVKNPDVMHHKIYYDDTKAMTLSPKKYKGKAVKLVVVNKTDYAKFDGFVDGLYANNVLDLKILEDFSDFESDAIDEEVDVEDTMTLLSEYVDKIDVETNIKKDRLKTLLKSLYIEAEAIEV
jgi:DNA repair exonuclease SbcCD nuclease subunit